MRYKGKLIKWNADKAFGFIQPNSGGPHVFMHKTALSNRKRSPQINDIITFSMTKDKNGRHCASEATFSGEKLNKVAPKKTGTFSIYLSLLFLVLITVANFAGQFPQKLLFGYFLFSVVTFLAYAFDKSKAQREAWRTPERKYITFVVTYGWLARRLISTTTFKT